MTANSRIKIVSGPYKGSHGTVLRAERVSGATILALIVKIDNDDSDGDVLVWPWEIEVVV